ncbi:zinc finger protein CONSTANS-LIKE 14 [Impatiens glandulifera]|uniref:zinc finger protein CONSTANS-LIKE 14 n=1 Tax=Impatiens glandulifera TaxID=253017 RepID=UPI001FB070AD|nr:zinc finger protein CONSTANS-LIKE 14 [Impatiens glandulifera]
MMNMSEISPHCDFCDERTAVLYCRADSAKLCLFCDQQVHSANALSLKHVRSQICDNCRSDSVTIRCTTDNLVLCNECDSDAHGNTSVASLHNRVSIHGFSGCPSVTELASVWGFVLNHKILTDKSSCQSRDSKVTNFHDLMFKSEHNHGASSSQSVPCFEIPMMQNLDNTSCGRYKSVVFKQLVDLAKREMVRLEGDVAELGHVELDSINVVDEEEMVLQETPFTSLLMFNDPVVEARGSDGIAKAQIWDFCSGRSMSCDQAGDTEVGCDPNGFGFTMNYSNNTMKESPLTTPDSFGDAYEMNCFSQYLNSPLVNVSHLTCLINCQKDGMDVTATKAQNSKFTEIVSSRESFQFKEHQVELVAQNKGNALLRYMEKKKARRFDKYVRYESRKARADTRKRVKGRFVKTCLLDEKSCT